MSNGKSTDESTDKSTDESSNEPSDRTVVQTAAAAAERVVFEQYAQSDVTDIDVTVTFEDGVLDVDVYLNAPADEHDPETVAQEAVEAAGDAVDELFGE